MRKTKGSIVFFALFAACIVLLSGCTESGQGVQQGAGNQGGSPTQGAGQGTGLGAGDGNQFRGSGTGGDYGPGAPGDGRAPGSGDANRFRDLNRMGGPQGRDANMMQGMPPGIAAELGLPEDATQEQINAALGLPADATMQQAWQAMMDNGIMPSAPPAQGNTGA